MYGLNRRSARKGGLYRHLREYRHPLLPSSSRIPSSSTIVTLYYRHPRESEDPAIHFIYPATATLFPSLAPIEAPLRSIFMRLKPTIIVTYVHTKSLFGAKSIFFEKPIAAQRPNSAISSYLAQRLLLTLLVSLNNNQEKHHENSTKGFYPN